MASLKLSEYRPCTVKGEKATFHRWIDIDRALLEMPNLNKDDIRRRCQKFFDETGKIPPGGQIRLMRKTMAIVEFEDGRVEQVEPEDICFVVRKKAMLSVDTADIARKKILVDIWGRFHGSNRDYAHSWFDDLADKLTMNNIDVFNISKLHLSFDTPKVSIKVVNHSYGIDGLRCDQAFYFPEPIRRMVLNDPDKKEFDGSVFQYILAVEEGLIE